MKQKIILTISFLILLCSLTGCEFLNKFINSDLETPELETSTKENHMPTSKYYVGDVLVVEDNLTSSYELQELIYEGITIDTWYINDQVYNAGDFYESDLSSDLEIRMPVYNYKDNLYEMAFDDRTLAVSITKYLGTERNLVIPYLVSNGNNIYKVTHIGYNSFSDSNTLASIEFPNSILTISDCAFQNCPNLTSIKLPNSPMSIENFVFSGCKNLTTIYIPEKINYISKSAFSGCNNLIKIIVDPKNKTYDSRDNCNGIIKTKENKLIFGCQSTVIPDTVTIIGMAAFVGCKNLKSIEIPNSVEKIENHAFWECRNLEKINIPNSVTTIEGDIFVDCNKLTSIIIPASVKTMGAGVFIACINLTIYCEAKEQPASWDSDWNLGNVPVVWDYKNK